MLLSFELNLFSRIVLMVMVSIPIYPMPWKNLPMKSKVIALCGRKYLCVCCGYAVLATKCRRYGTVLHVEHWLTAQLLRLTGLVAVSLSFDAFHQVHSMVKSNGKYLEQTFYTPIIQQTPRMCTSSGCTPRPHIQLHSV